MIYLIEQYAWFLFAAFVVGIVIGWFTFEGPYRKDAG